MFSHLYTPETERIRAILRQGGHSMWFVGGSVRDALTGKECHDIDILTNGTPEDVMPLFEAAGVDVLPIGINHGTFCAFLDGEKYEITTVKHGSIWMDLMHRDLTINAMAVDFDTGSLIDPHHGADDLKNGVVQFVGSPEERIKEDPLRILRFIRFNRQFSPETLVNWGGGWIKEYIHLLDEVSPERMWIEIGKALTHKKAREIFVIWTTLRIGEQIGLYPAMGVDRRLEHLQSVTDDPVAIFAGLAPSADVSAVGARFKWPGKERAKARIIHDHMNNDIPLPVAKIRIAAHNEPRQWVILALRMTGRIEEADKLAKWKRPTFPLSAVDLLHVDDETVAILKCEWADSGFRITRDGMLKRLIAG